MKERKMEQRNGAQVLKRGTSILLFISHLGLASDNQLRTYIVHVRKLNSQERESWYRSFLPDTATTNSSSSEPRMVYAYSEVIHGFAARLTPEEVESMKAKMASSMLTLMSSFTFKQPEPPSSSGLALNRDSGHMVGSEMAPSLAFVTQAYGRNTRL
ncbi:hypothetical protein AMTR_s00069p00178570 [Amborella trichopoda]|uniref:Inhibitor I9 domain-containing protein n=1 Tax=Amborella trichopoda TaxID=13333 RepID=U5D1D4_AMBTC|nr:hypothetical protein AMTR_s00069p00178570 [Amborella trichopoda]